MPIGRPTKYNAELLEKAQKYLEVYEQHGDVVPTIEGLSLYLDVGERTIYTWAGEKSKKEFQHTLARLKSKQKQMIVAKGLTGDFNSAIAKLVLSANHGMHEKQEHGHSGGVAIERITRTIVD